MQKEAKEILTQSCFKVNMLKISLNKKKCLNIKTLAKEGIIINQINQMKHKIIKHLLI